MKTNGHRLNGLIDAALFAGFVLACFLELTGQEAHQWLGLAVGGLALYHLWRHQAWVRAVAQRLGQRLARRAGLYAAIDFGLFAGLGVIISTGVVISSWLNLPLTAYAAWRTVHVGSTLAMLGLLLLKIGLHWRWIASALRPRARAQAAPMEASAASATGALGARSAGSASKGAAGTLRHAYGVSVRPYKPDRALGRRDFLGVMGVTTLAVLLAATRAVDVPSASAASQVATTAGASAQNSAAASAGSASAALSTCQVRCNRRCAYPGRCGRYTDSNNNGRCDWGECL